MNNISKELDTRSKTMQSVLNEIEEASRNVPFGNSLYQIDNFIINAAYTPARAYKAIMLQLSEKIKSLKEAEYNSRKHDIDVRELKFKIAKLERNMSEEDSFELERMKLDLEKKTIDSKEAEKLIEDAIIEAEHLYKRFKQLPKYTREEFEREEAEHYNARLKLLALQLSEGHAQGDLLLTGEKLPQDHPLSIAIGELIPERITDLANSGRLEGPNSFRKILENKKEELNRLLIDNMQNK